MPSVEVDLDNFGKGATVTIPDLGGFENGSTTEVTQARFNRFANKPNTKHMVTGDTIVVTSATLSGEPAKATKAPPADLVESKQEDDVDPEEESSG